MSKRTCAHDWLFAILAIWLITLSSWLIIHSNGTGGRPFSMAWDYDPGLYDPQRTSDPIAYSIFRFVCEPLFYEDFDGQARGLLANDDFVYQDEGRSVMVYLRPNVYFHNGAPVDAYAVQQSFVRLIEYGISPLADQFDGVNIVVLDTNTVEFRLPKPNYDFVRLVLSNPYAAVVAAPSDSEVDPSFVSCTGPYKFASTLYRPNKQLSLVRYEQYRWPPYDAKNQYSTNIHQLSFFFESDRDKRFKMLLKNQLCGLSINAEQAAVLSGNQDFRLYQTNGGVTYLGYNFLKPRWQDVHLRKAISMSINKTALAEQGPFVVAETPLTRSATGYDSRAARFTQPYDPEQARSMIIGMNTDLNAEIILLTPESNTYHDLSRMIAQNLKDVGFNNIRIREVARTDISTQRLDFDLLLFDYAWGDYTALSIFLGTGPHNLLYYPENDVASLIDGALSTPDLKQRKDMILEAQKIVLQDAIWNPLLVREIVLAINARCVNGEQLSPFGELILHDAYTR